MSFCDPPNRVGRPRIGEGHLRRRDGLRRIRERDLAQPFEPSSEPARPVARGRDQRGVPHHHGRLGRRLGGCSRAALDRGRQAVAVRKRAGRVPAGVFVRPRRRPRTPRHTGRLGRAAGVRRGRKKAAAVLHGRDRRTARPAASLHRARRQGSETALRGARESRHRVRTDIPALRRHVLARRRPSGASPAAGRRQGGAYAGGQWVPHPESRGAEPPPAPVPHHQDAGRCGAQRLDHQAQGVRSVASLSPPDDRVRGARFKKQTYLHLGRYESADQIAAARWFAAQPYVDPDRIGIWGWSYGGYMSSLTMFRGAGVFKAALAVAPVTDWRFYDTIYTERYMRTPQENQAGYDESASLTYADSLKSSFLLVHGTGDDRSEEHTSELQSRLHLVCRLLLEK